MNDSRTSSMHAGRAGKAGPEMIGRAASAADFLRLARPKQWAKGIFVLIGPLYWLADGHAAEATWGTALAVIGAVFSFGLTSSASYILNDIRDREADALHPRKRKRPIASGAISPRAAARFAVLLLVLAIVSLLLIPSSKARWLVALTVGVYLLNGTLYSLVVKHVLILDVISLALGFVLRVLAGCTSITEPPTTWLLNSTFFLAMFLAFGKRLGERRTMGRDAAAIRAVQSGYTDDLLRMAVVVTAVATLVTYFGYVQAHEHRHIWGFNLLWLTVLPATYAMLRSIVLLESGRYDDPTELAASDRPIQAAALLFVLLTISVAAGWLQGLLGT